MPDSVMPDLEETPDLEVTADFGKMPDYTMPDFVHRSDSTRPDFEENFG